jgi:thioredoxin 1
MIFLGIFKHKRKNLNSKHKIPSAVEWPDYVVTLEGKNFNEFIQRYPLSMVDFWAPWCAPCRVIAPRIRRLSKIYRGKVAFGRLNTQNNQDIVKQYKIMGIPHLIFFRFGKKITSITGLKSVGELKNVIDNLLKKAER